MEALEISCAYDDHSASRYDLELFINVPSVRALARILTRIERAPHQVAVRHLEGMPHLWGRVPDAPNPIPLATIVDGMTPEEAEGARQLLKSKNWTPGARLD